MKTCVIYARYSSSNQTEQSIEGQLKVCYEYAESHNYTVVGEYIDRAQSGKFDNRAFLKDAAKPVSIAVERADGQIATTHTFIHGTPEMAAADRYYIDRLVKTELWMKGGYKVYVNEPWICRCADFCTFRIFCLYACL